MGDTFVVLARTSPEKAQKGITAFVLEKGMKGFSQRAIHGKLGMRSSDTAELHMEDVEVPDENRIGDVDHGFLDTLSILDRGRITIGALAVGLGRGALEEARAYAKERKAFGKPIAEFQAIAFALADMATEVDAARLLVLRSAALCDAEAALRTRGLHGQALRQRGGHARHHQGHPDPGRLRLHPRLPGGALLPGRQALRDRRGDERDPAARHRPLRS